MAGKKDKVSDDLRQYLWNYFQVHASQRLTTFHFYILISTVIATGYVVVLRDSGMVGLAVGLGLILSLLSLIFWKLDQRNRWLIENAEDGLKYIEEMDGLEEGRNYPHVLNVFGYEEARTNENQRDNGWWSLKRRIWTYKVCMNGVFIVFGVVGLIGVVYSIIRLVARGG